MFRKPRRGYIINGKFQETPTKPSPQQLKVLDAVSDITYDTKAKPPVPATQFNKRTVSTMVKKGLITETNGIISITARGTKVLCMYEAGCFSRSRF